MAEPSTGSVGPAGRAAGIPRDSPALRYGFAVACVAGGWLAREALIPVLGPTARPFITFFPAVAIAAWYGGLGPGLVCTVLAALTADWLFIRPVPGLVLQSSADVASIVTFVVGCGFIVGAFEALHRTRSSLARENAERLRTEAELVAGRQALLREKELYATTLASIGDAVIVTDSAGRVTFLNAEAERLTGWVAADALGQDLMVVFRILNEQSRQSVESPVAKVLRRGGVVGLANHTVLVARDGVETPIDDSAAPIRAPGGPVFGVVLVFRDVTARRRAEQKLSLAEEQHRSVVDHVVDGIVSIDEAGIVQSFNRAAEKIFGYAAADVVGRNVSMLMPAPYRDEHDRYLANYHRTGERKIIGIGREVEGLRKDGTTFPMDLAVSEFHQGERRRFTGLVRDITERKRAETALRESEERFRGMADAAPVLIWVSGPDRRCTWFNKQWLEFVGRPMERELGDGWAENVHPDDVDRCLHTYVTAFDARQPFTMIYRLRRRDGVYRWLLDSGMPQYRAASEFIGFIGSCVDITEQKEAEEALQEAARRKDEFLAILSHELRNPIAPIRLAVALLKEIGPPEPELQELRDIIDRQTLQLTRLLDDLLDVSRIASGKIVLRKERVGLGVAVASAVESVRPLVLQQGHDLRVRAPAEPLYVEGDPARLAQVFTNLLHNAARYTESGGRIDLTLDREGSDAVVRVRDNGIGISAEHLSHIFEMFTQLDDIAGRGQGGLGVGLALSRRLVEMHGGHIEARSEGSGTGSEFTVRLPAVVAAEVPAAPARAARVPSRHRILVADDNVDSATALAKVLRHAGHDVRVAHEGARAVEVATESEPDWAILDIGMPGLSGYEAARRIRARLGGRVTLVAVTGWGQDEDKRRSIEAGFDHHLTKPVDPAVLEGLMAQRA